MRIIPLFTAADVQGKTLFRTVKVQLHLKSGSGHIHLERSQGHTFAPEWLETLQVLQRLLHTLPGLPLSECDLHVQPLGPSTHLAGRSAALPLWLAWLSLFTARELPQPFLATGVIFDDAQLQPAPQAFIDGKVKVAEALARAHRRTHERPVHFYYPAGSELSSLHTDLLVFTPLNTLWEAATQVLSIERPMVSSDPPVPTPSVHSILQPGSLYHDLSRA